MASLTGRSLVTPGPYIYTYTYKLPKRNSSSKQFFIQRNVFDIKKIFEEVWTGSVILKLHINLPRSAALCKKWENIKSF